MKERARAAVRAFLREPSFSPLGFLRGALLLTALFLAAHAAGLREHTRFLSGTEPAGQGGELELVLGVLYAMLYFACVLGAPILAIAAGLLFGVERLARRAPPPPLPPND